MNRFISLFKYLFCFILMMPAVTFAHVIQITANTPFPQSINAGVSATAFFTVTNIASRARFTPVVLTNFPRNSGLSLGSTTCNGLLNPKQSCTVTLQLNAPATAMTINSALQIWAKPSADGVQYPFTIKVNARGNSRYVYAANFGNETISVCQINSLGALTNCQYTGNNFGSPRGLAVNPAGSLLYVVSLLPPGEAKRAPASGFVTFCKINADGSLSSCNRTIQSGLNIPTGIAINPSNSYAYIASTVVIKAKNIPVYPLVYCKINSDGSLSGCVQTGTGITSNPTGLTVNASGNRLYVVSAGANAAYVCPINGNGSLGACSVTGSSTDGPYGIALNPSNTYSYQANNSCSSVMVCNVDQANGSFSHCINNYVGVTLACYANRASLGGAGIVTNASGTIAYIAQNAAPYLTYCSIATDGSLTACQQTGTGFDVPVGVAVV